MTNPGPMFSTGSSGGFKKTEMHEFHANSSIPFYFHTPVLALGIAVRLCYAIGQVCTCQIVAGQIGTGIDHHEKA